jgi:hypothetical protein
MVETMLHVAAFTVALTSALEPLTINAKLNMIFDTRFQLRMIKGVRVTSNTDVLLLDDSRYSDITSTNRKEER